MTRTGFLRPGVSRSVRRRFADLRSQPIEELAGPGMRRIQFQHGAERSARPLRLIHGRVGHGQLVQAFGIAGMRPGGALQLRQCTGGGEGRAGHRLAGRSGRRRALQQLKRPSPLSGGQQSRSEQGGRLM